jgi:LysM repeat protein
LTPQLTGRNAGCKRLLAYGHYWFPLNNLRKEQVKEMKSIITILTAVMLLTIGTTPALAQTSTCGNTYTVQPGDYVSKIAQQCDVSYLALLDANPQITDPSLIYPGQVIQIPNGSSGNTSGIPVTGGSVYIAQSGDTLASIADHFGVTVNTLVNSNPGLTQTSLIYPGRRITLPQGAERVPTVSITPAYGVIGSNISLSATGFRANKPVVVGFGQVGKTSFQLDKTTTDANGAVYRQYQIPKWSNVVGQDGQYQFLVQRSDDSSIHAFSNPFYLTGTGEVGSGGIPVTGGSPFYIVQLGDTLHEIALNYGTAVNTLLTLNPAIGSGKLIYPGQRLFLPGTSSVTPSGSFVSIAPLAAKPGDRIQVRAGNFPASAMVDVRIAKQGQSFTDVVDGQADAQGIVNSSIIVPPSAQAGEQWVVIVTTTERPNGTRVVSQPITIQ